jgi:hypothetical protein
VPPPPAPAAPSAGSATVLTDAAGLATAPAFVANGTAGGYQVTATAAFGSNPSTALSLSNAPPSPAPPVSDPRILWLSPMVERAWQRTLTIRGLGFTPGSVLLINGRPVATRFRDGTGLQVPRFLRQVRLLRGRRPPGRLAAFEEGLLEGLLTLQVLVPGAGATPPAPLEVQELVGRGGSGTPRERAVAEAWEDAHHQEAHTSPAFARLLRRLRARGLCRQQPAPRAPGGVGAGVPGAPSGNPEPEGPRRSTPRLVL